VRQGEPAFGHHLDEITKAELVAQIPPHTEDDDLPIEMAAFEEFIHAQHASQLHQELRGCEICPASDLCTTTVSVTDAGQRLLEQLRSALGQISDALEDLNRERSRPFGRLRIYATNMAGAGVIAPVWQRFLSTYPEVHLELQLGEAPVDIVAKGFDAGVGPQDRGPPTWSPSE
jgi:hypothetical protein